MQPHYTKLAADGSALPADATHHQAVQVDHDLLARPIIVTAHRSPESMTWHQAKQWAESLNIHGWQWRLPTVEEAFLIVDRSRAESPALPPEYFPDCEGEWIWTATDDAQPPSGYAWYVYLGYGLSSRLSQRSHSHVRAVRAKVKAIVESQPAPKSDAPCTTCDGRGRTAEIVDYLDGREEAVMVDCPDCGASGKASQQITPARKEGAQS